MRETEKMRVYTKTMIKTGRYSHRYWTNDIMRKSSQLNKPIIPILENLPTGPNFISS
jgi:hypothetical protein